MRHTKPVIFGFLLLLLGGCAANKPLYNWGSYEPQVYSFFKGETLEAQVEVLEKHLDETKANGLVPPPGFYAHLGMLYSKVGRGAEVQAMFAMEKKLYPESGTFIENINNGFKVSK